MNPVKEEDFVVPEGGKKITFAKNQPQYNPLPAAMFPVQDGIICSEWELTLDEVSTLIKRMEAGQPIKIRLWTWTFRTPLQPCKLELL